MGTELELDLGGWAGHPGMHGHPTIINDPPMGQVSVNSVETRQVILTACWIDAGRDDMSFDRRMSD
jgi:hypothetical protein